MKRLIEPVFAAIVGELAQQHRGQQLAFLDRDDHAEQVLPMRLNQIPIHHIVTEEGVDVFIHRVFGWSIELQVFPVADARHELHA